MSLPYSNIQSSNSNKIVSAFPLTHQLGTPEKQRSSPEFEAMMEASAKLKASSTEQRELDLIRSDLISVKNRLTTSRLRQTHLRFLVELASL